METITNWAEVTMNAFLKMGEQLSSNLLSLLGAVIILLLGWLITKVIAFLLKKILKTSRIDDLSDKVKDAKLFGEAGLDFELSSVIVAFVRWILYLVFLIVAADILGWTIISNEISSLVAYLPKLFSAITLFVVGLYIANFIKRALKGFLDALSIVGSSLISSFVFFVILIIFSVTALNQANIDTSAITNNLVIILAGLVLIFVISLGVGSIDIVQKILYTYYVRRSVNVGDTVIYKGLKGEVESIGNLVISIRNEEGLLSIPVKDFINETTLKQ
ncbi:mechanosensitive ion channel domain-containing protein [Belliella marina]|uniref:Mechanosensitive ion channel domain-containing protein n=1 Tax=Belliella marina TaxID=1644146 RepID=A0ABW4VSL6_9BACT